MTRTKELKLKDEDFSSEDKDLQIGLRQGQGLSSRTPSLLVAVPCSFAFMLQIPACDGVQQ